MTRDEAAEHVARFLGTLPATFTETQWEKIERAADQMIEAITTPTG